MSVFAWYEKMEASMVGSWEPSTLQFVVGHIVRDCHLTHSPILSPKNPALTFKRSKYKTSPRLKQGVTLTPTNFASSLSEDASTKEHWNVALCERWELALEPSRNIGEMHFAIGPRVRRMRLTHSLPQGPNRARKRDTFPYLEMLYRKRQSGIWFTTRCASCWFRTMVGRVS